MLGNSCPGAIAVWRRGDGKGTALQAVVCQHAITLKPLTYDAGGFDPTAGCKPKVYHTSRVHLSLLLLSWHRRCLLFLVYLHCRRVDDVVTSWDGRRERADRGICQVEISTLGGFSGVILICVGRDGARSECCCIACSTALQVSNSCPCMENRDAQLS